MDMRKTSAPNEGSPRRTWLRKDAKCSSLEYKTNAQTQRRLVHTKSRRWWVVCKGRKWWVEGIPQHSREGTINSWRVTNWNSYKSQSKKKKKKHLIHKRHEFKPIGKHGACIKWIEDILDFKFIHHSNSDANVPWNPAKLRCVWMCTYTYIVKRGV